MAPNGEGGAKPPDIAVAERPTQATPEQTRAEQARSLANNLSQSGVNLIAIRSIHDIGNVYSDSSNLDSRVVDQSVLDNSTVEVQVDPQPATEAPLPFEQPAVASNEQPDSNLLEADAVARQPRVPDTILPFDDVQQQANEAKKPIQDKNGVIVYPVGYQVPVGIPVMPMMYPGVFEVPGQKPKELDERGKEAQELAQDMLSGLLLNGDFNKRMDYLKKLGGKMDFLPPDMLQALKDDMDIYKSSNEKSKLKLAGANIRLFAAKFKYYAPMVAALMAGGFAALGSGNVLPLIGVAAGAGIYGLKAREGYKKAEIAAKRARSSELKKGAINGQEVQFMEFMASAAYPDKTDVIKQEMQGMRNALNAVEHVSKMAGALSPNVNLARV